MEYSHDNLFSVKKQSHEFYYSNASTTKSYILLVKISYRRHGGKVLSDECFQYSRTCSMQNLHSRCSCHASIIDKVSDSLYCFVTTHPPHIELFLEVEGSGSDIVLRLDRNKRRCCLENLLLRWVGMLQAIEFDIDGNMPKDNESLGRGDLLYLTSGALSCYLHIVAW